MTLTPDQGWLKPALIMVLCLLSPCALQERLGAGKQPGLCSPKDGRLDQGQQQEVGLLAGWFVFIVGLGLFWHGFIRHSL